MPLTQLPIDPLVPEIVRAVQQHRGAVVTAEPGAGKTTRVPPALLRGDRDKKKTLVLEPRRIAARLSAERVASETGTRLGELVGFVTRFERSLSERSQLIFMTEGILSRRLLSDPALADVATVVFDEFHERHIATDVGLGVLRRLRAARRPDLELVVMSATLDAQPIARFLDAPVLSSVGRAFPVAIEHAARSDDRPLDSQVASALFELLGRGLSGHVLVFLPGAREIRRCEETARKLAAQHDLAIVPLYGSQSTRDQDAALRPSERRKVILSTNVAETSVTIDGVVAVIDSGLAHVASCSPWTGLPSLKLSKISRASAEQRAGRAGRTQPGVAIRLYTSGDLAARPAFEVPEIARSDLAEPLLELVAQGVTNPAGFEWFEAPPATSMDSALQLLLKLGALDGTPAELRVSRIGTRMLDFPAHPRQARILVESERRGVSSDGCTMAAIVGERPFGSLRDARRASSERSDLFALMDDLDGVEAISHERARLLGIDRPRALAALRVRDQLRRIASDRAPRPAEGKAFEDALLMSVLAGYPDRVGRLKKADARAGRQAAEIVLASGGGATLAETSRVRETDLLVAVDVEDRVDGARQRTTVRLASAVEADWILELFTDSVTDEEVLEIGASGRVEASRVLKLGSLVLEQERTDVRDLERAAELLADAVLKKGLALAQKEALERLAVRLTLLREHGAPLGALSFDPGDLASVVREACRGRTSIAEVLEVDVGAVAEHTLTTAQQRLLRELAPEVVHLPSGRSLKIAYRLGSSPSVASRLQDFFGLAEGPRILGDARPLLLELLAPNQRAVQVTTDLAGFWERHYPSIAKELRRKYPRHSWPDDPLHAEPKGPQPRKQR